MYTVYPEYPSIHWDPLGAIPYPATGFQPSVQTCGRLEETLGSSWLLVQPPENGSDNGNLKYTWYRARLRHGRDNANLKFTPQNTATHWQRFSQESSPHRGEDDATRRTDLESLLLTESLYLLARHGENGWYHGVKLQRWTKTHSVTLWCSCYSLKGTLQQAFGDHGCSSKGVTWLLCPPFLNLRTAHSTPQGLVTMDAYSVVDLPTFSLSWRNLICSLVVWGFLPSTPHPGATCRATELVC